MCASLPAAFIRAAALGCLLTLQAGAGELLPPDHGPTDPEIGDKVAMAPLTRRAIAMFDATPQSDRHYDLVSCLDGLTFAFGNQPQMQLIDFFKELRDDQGGATFKVLLARLREHFLADAADWKQLASRAGISTSADPSEDNIKKALEATLLDASFMKPYAKKFPVKQKSDTECTALGGTSSRSFFNDHAVWFRPAMRFALRDSDIVAFQVRNWEKLYLARGIKAADGLKLPAESGAILLTFIRSNPGQVPEPPRATLLKGVAPVSMKIAGRAWRWDGTDRPAAIVSADLNAWRQMLIWQVMCFARDRIRNRNLAFFAEFLGPAFTLPVMNGKLPAEKSTKENCDPARVRLAN